MSKEKKTLTELLGEFESLAKQWQELDDQQKAYMNSGIVDEQRKKQVLDECESKKITIQAQCKEIAETMRGMKGAPVIRDSKMDNKVLSK